MDEKTFSFVAGVIFAVVALFHLVRIFMEWTVIIGDWSIPMWASWIALVVAGGLALLGLRLAACPLHLQSLCLSRKRNRETTKRQISKNKKDYHAPPYLLGSNTNPQIE